MKKMLRFLKYVLISILSLIVFFCLYFFISNKIFLGGTDDTFVAYLKENKLNVGGEIDPAFFDDDFYHSDIFLLGEIHGFAGNQDMDKKMLLLLNKKIGVRYYVAEMDSVHADKLNTFLRKTEKDTELLKEVVNGIKKRIPQQAGQELYNKWSDIYDYNRTLHDSLQITVLGIDKNFDNDTATFSRDSIMIMNFRNIVAQKKLEGEHFYGLFGFYHVLQSAPIDKGKPLAARLKTSHYKVASIVSYTLDSEMFMPKDLGMPTNDTESVPMANADGPLMLVKGINDLKAVTKPNTQTLFRLTQAQSPYLDTQRLSALKAHFMGEDLLPKDGYITPQYFQYALLLRNSKAITRLK